MYPIYANCTPSPYLGALTFSNIAPPASLVIFKRTHAGGYARTSTPYECQGKLVSSATRCLNPTSSNNPHILVGANASSHTLMLKMLSD